MRDCRGGKRGRWIVAQAVDMFMFSLLITTFLLNRFTTRTMMATTNGHHTHNYTPLLAPEHAQDASAGLFFCFTYSTNVFSFFLNYIFRKDLNVEGEGRGQGCISSRICAQSSAFFLVNLVYYVMKKNQIQQVKVQLLMPKDCFQVDETTIKPGKH